ncbi:hypothetical protein [Photobacterium damselae]|uniref:hypothetical protein n=1 Tax=Photobacterium damselae TaxID=38293 RepID=UPI001594DE8A|nr:hypothetical protein [Photobacterium damselae]NVH48867.1 hypothetical protein [Photobacterium damselae subsp. damselae]
MAELGFNTANDELFITSCKIIAYIINELGIDSSTKGYLRDSVRIASLKSAGKLKSGKHMARWISFDAIEVQNRGPKVGELILEHSVPVKVILSSVCELVRPTYLDIAKVIHNMAGLAVITKEEDAKISKLKLGSRMPEDWDGRDQFIRYKLAGIELVENPF